MSTSPISKLRAADDERRQAKRNSVAEKLTVEAKTLADLKIKEAGVEGEPPRHDPLFDHLIGSRQIGSLSPLRMQMAPEPRLSAV